jgi:hypothetical protein
LGRPINPTALPTRLQDLARMGRQNFALSLLTSLEYDTKEVDSFFALYLRRLPKLAAVQTNVTALQQATLSTNQLIANLVGSLEYVQKAAIYPTDYQNRGTLQAGAGKILSLGTVNPNRGILFAGAGGVINIGGNLTQDAGGVVSAAVAGTAASQFGLISVSGAATLTGTLNISFVSGFIPSSGQRFKVLTYGSHTGTFDAVRFVGLPSGLTVTVQYNSGDLTLVVT